METLIGILLGIFFAVFFFILILGFFEIEWFKWLRNFFYALSHRELKRELDFNPIKDMCEFKSQERARLIQEWDKEYLNLLPVGKRESGLNKQKVINLAKTRREELTAILLRPSMFEDQPTEQETDREFVYWQQQSIKKRYEGGYDARGHQSYY